MTLLWHPSRGALFLTAMVAWVVFAWAIVASCATCAASSSSSENHRLIPFAHSISHMRNRVYAPGIGRFMQPDPNATGQTLLHNDWWFHGVPPEAALVGLT